MPLGKTALRHYSFSSSMKTDLHHGLNLAVISYRLLERMANMGRWGQKRASCKIVQLLQGCVQFYNQVTVYFCEYCIISPYSCTNKADPCLTVPTEYSFCVIIHGLPYVTPYFSRSVPFCHPPSIMSRLLPY